MRVKQIRENTADPPTSMHGPCLAVHRPRPSLPGPSLPTPLRLVICFVVPMGACSLASVRSLGSAHSERSSVLGADLQSKLKRVNSTAPDCSRSNGNQLLKCNASDNQLVKHLVTAHLVRVVRLVPPPHVHGRGAGRRRQREAQAGPPVVCVCVCVSVCVCVRARACVCACVRVHKRERAS
jgi:hypothetical protein